MPMISTADASRTPAEQLLQRIERLDSEALETSSSHSPTVLVLFTPSYAQEATSPSFVRQVAQRVFNTTSLSDGQGGAKLQAITALVDRLPRAVHGIAPINDNPSEAAGCKCSDSTSGEGIAYTLVHSVAVENVPEAATVGRHGGVGTEDDVRTLTVKVLQAAPSATLSNDGRVSAFQIPLANTLFQTGHPQTMLLWTFKNGADDKAKHIRSAITILDVGAVGCYEKRVDTMANLVPLTLPQRVHTAMGNVMRQLSDPDDPSKTFPASKQLEEAVAAYFRARDEPMRSVGAWALIMPKSFYRSWEDADQSVQAKDLPALWLSPQSVRQDHIPAIVAAGGRLVKVLSGGGGWGKRAGLLSLDYETTFSSNKEGALQEEMNPFEGPTFNASPDAAKPGELVQFFIYDNQRLSADDVSADPSGKEQSMNSPLLTLEFGTALSSEDAVSESMGEDNRNAAEDQSDLSKINISRINFGALAEKGVAVMQTNADGQERWTKIDVPNSTVLLTLIRSTAQKRSMAQKSRKHTPSSRRNYSIRRDEGRPLNALEDNTGSPEEIEAAKEDWNPPAVNQIPTSYAFERPDYEFSSRARGYALMRAKKNRTKAQRMSADRRSALDQDTGLLRTQMLRPALRKVVAPHKTEEADRLSVNYEARLRRLSIRPPEYEPEPKWRCGYGLLEDQSFRKYFTEPGIQKWRIGLEDGASVDSDVNLVRPVQRMGNDFRDRNVRIVSARDVEDSLVEPVKSNVRVRRKAEKDSGLRLGHATEPELRRAQDYKSTPDFVRPIFPESQRQVNRQAGHIGLDLSRLPSALTVRRPSDMGGRRQYSTATRSVLDSKSEALNTAKLKQERAARAAHRTASILDLVRPRRDGQVNIFDPHLANDGKAKSPREPVGGEGDRVSEVRWHGIEKANRREQMKSARRRLAQQTAQRNGERPIFRSVPITRTHHHELEQTVQMDGEQTILPDISLQRKHGYEPAGEAEPLHSTPMEASRDAAIEHVCHKEKAEKLVEEPSRAVAVPGKAMTEAEIHSLAKISQARLGQYRTILRQLQKDAPRAEAVKTFLQRAADYLRSVQLPQIASWLEIPLSQKDFRIPRSLAFIARPPCKDLLDTKNGVHVFARWLAKKRLNTDSTPIRYDQPRVGPPQVGSPGQSPHVEPRKRARVFRRRVPLRYIKYHAQLQVVEKRVRPRYVKFSQRSPMTYRESSRANAHAQAVEDRQQATASKSSGAYEVGGMDLLTRATGNDLRIRKTRFTPKPALINEQRLVRTHYPRDTIPSTASKVGRPTIGADTIGVAQEPEMKARMVGSTSAHETGKYRDPALAKLADTVSKLLEDF